jgi:hypothetical protein
MKNIEESRFVASFKAQQSYRWELDIIKKNFKFDER